MKKIIYIVLDGSKYYEENLSKYVHINLKENDLATLKKMRGVMTYDIKRKWKVPEQRMDKSFWMQNNFLTSSFFSRE